MSGGFGQSPTQFRLRFIDASTINIIRDEYRNVVPVVGDRVHFSDFRGEFIVKRLHQDLLQNRTIVYVAPAKGAVDHPETQTKEVAEVSSVVSMAARANDATLQTPEKFRVRFIDTSTLNIIRDERWNFAPKVGEVVLFDNIEWPFKIEKLHRDPSSHDRTIVYVAPVKSVVDHNETQTKEVDEVNKVVSMAAAANNAAMQTPEQALHACLEDVGTKGALKKGKKILILSLDDTDDDYNVSFNQAGMSMSECLALTEVGKALFLTEMGYLE